MAHVKLTGGLSPASGSDPRTFPNIYNPLVDTVEGLEIDVAQKSDIGHQHANSIARIVHGSNPNVARVTGYASVEWVGTVAPVNAEANDTWLVTAEA